MAISIDPSTFIITVPKDDMLLVQSSPIEIRELDIDNFRLELKGWEDSASGITMQKTHDHNTSVTISGVQLARVVEILEPYTITFEDGSYAVNLVGANSNIADRVNLNAVSVRAANSAGLIQTREIEYSSFDGGVTVNVNSGNSGTDYPFGTPAYPVNNLSDAVFIANLRGFVNLYINESMTLDSGTDISGFYIIGRSHVNTDLVMDTSADCENITIRNCKISGVLDGGTHIEDCSVGDINYVNGHIHDCGLFGTIILDGNKDAVIANCFSIDQDSNPIVDMGGTGQDLAMPNYAGIITIENFSDATGEIGVGLNAGMVFLDSTITAGTVIVSGVGIATDNTTGSTIVNIDGLISKDTISQAVLNTDISNYDGENTVASTFKFGNFSDMVAIDVDNGDSGTEYPLGTPENPVNNLSDAVTIAESYGFTKLNFLSDYTFTSSDALSNYCFCGQGLQDTTLTFDYGSQTLYCQAQDAKLTGSAFGLVTIKNCLLENYGASGLAASDKDATIINCILNGTVTFPSNYTGTMLLIDCYSGGTTESDSPSADLNGANCSVIARNYSGAITLSEIDDSTANYSLDFSSGTIIMDSTVTAGNFVFRGIAELQDESTSVTSLDTSGLISQNTISDGVWEETSADHTDSTTMGGKLNTASSGGVDYDALGAAVWDRDTADHTTAGTFGEKVGKKLLTVAKFLGLK